MTDMPFIAGGAALLAVALVGCSSSASQSAPSDAPFTPTPAKTWVVDTSGWWVPEDPTGCLTETTTCPMSAWPTREYRKGQVAANVMRHGDELTLYCKAPTPTAIRNSLKVESVHWFYAQQGGEYWWIPDIYVTKDDVDEMAEGVPDCASNTPGLNGGPPASPMSVSGASAT